MTSSERKKVLIVDNSTGYTGAFKSILGFASELGDEFLFHFAIPEKSASRKLLEEKGYAFIEIPFLEIGKNWKLLLYLPLLIRNTRTLLAYCREHRIDLIHVNDLYNMTGVLAKMLNKKIKVIYHVRLLPDSYVRALYGFWRRLITHFADAIIVVSNSVAKSWRTTGRELQLIYDFIPLADKVRLQPPHVTFLYLSNFVRGKGQDYALKAFFEVQKGNPGCSLLFAGNDLGLEKNIQFRKSLEKEASKMGIGEKVRFEGWSADIEMLMKSSEVVLNFSESESFSMVCYEALTFGRPLIATDSGGPGELVENTVSGLLVPNRDVRAMSKAMNELLSDEARRIAMGESAAYGIRAKVAAHGAINRLRVAYGDLLKEL